MVARFDVVVACDDGIKREIMATVGTAAEDVRHYERVVCSLTTFMHYCR